MIPIGNSILACAQEIQGLLGIRRIPSQDYNHVTNSIGIPLFGSNWVGSIIWFTRSELRWHPRQATELSAMTPVVRSWRRPRSATAWMVEAGACQTGNSDGGGAMEWWRRQDSCAGSQATVLGYPFHFLRWLSHDSLACLEMASIIFWDGNTWYALRGVQLDERKDYVLIDFPPQVVRLQTQESTERFSSPIVVIDWRDCGTVYILPSGRLARTSFTVHSRYIISLRYVSMAMAYLLENLSYWARPK